LSRLYIIGKYGLPDQPSSASLQLFPKPLDERNKIMATLQMESKHAVPDLMLSQTRVIRASRARVYEAWTNPEILKAWFGPAGMQCPNAQLDARDGGSYRIDMLNPSEGAAAKGTTHVSATGQYTKVVPDELLQFTWIPSMNPDEHTLVTISFKDAPGGTELTLVHEHFSSEASRDGHTNGWSGSFDKLAALLEA
jgi:uncharacterized protein YndB with AHSA1/START domain